MKHFFYIFLLSVVSADLIHTKALPVRSPHRSDQQTICDTDQLKKDLFSQSCKTILIQVDDPESAIKLIRYAQPLKEQKKTVLCKAPEQVRMLLSWCPFVDHMVLDEHEATYDVSITLEDLAHVMGKTTDDVALDTAYIKVSEPLRALWQEAFITDTAFKVGICCSPIYHSSYKAKQPLTIESFLPLGCMQYMSLYSFDDITDHQIPDNINLFHFDAKRKRSLPDLAVIMDHMDLIITTQPIIAYISESLGKKVWFIADEHMDADELHNTCNQLRIFTQNRTSNVVFEIMHELAYMIEKPAARIVTAEIATGELIDKMSILEIKAERIDDQEKLDNIHRELHSLQGTLDEFVTVTPELEKLMKELKAANEALWTTEDLIRDKEREKCFDNEFILLARSVYIQNDERCRVKKAINKLLGSRLEEVKSYKQYN